MKLYRSAMVLIFAAVAGSGCSSPGKESPVLMARGMELHGLYLRYSHAKSGGLSPYASLAVHNCERNRFEECIPALEHRLQHHAVSVPKDDGHIEQAWHVWQTRRSAIALRTDN